MRVDLIGFDSGWGCKDFGCEDGPGKISIDQILHCLTLSGVEARWHGPLGLKFLGSHEELNSKEKTLPVVIQCLNRLSKITKQSVENKNIPVVIGGDHSSAIGTWSGVISGAKAHQKFGLIWMDAHLDAHTYETSSQGKWGGWWHGQPVAALTGFGLQKFSHLLDEKQKISPKHISMIGIHSFEPAEVEFIKNNNIHVYYLDEVKKRGFKAVFDESLKRATDGTSGFGLTIDLDSFRSADAPGVGTPEDDGLIAKDVLPILKSVAHTPSFRALEIAEFNPHNDKNGRTRQLITALIKDIFTKC